MRSAAGDGQHCHGLQLNDACLTAWNDNPDKIHEKEVEPEIVSFRPAIRQILVVMIEHAGSVVENQAVNLAEGNQGLERMS